MEFFIKSGKVVIVTTFLFLCFSVHAEELCSYKNSAKKIITVKSKKSVPSRYRKKAYCFDTKPQTMAAPNQIELKGNVRKESISTSLGRMNLKWPRTAEKLFGRTPVRALSDVARTASRFLKVAGFSNKVRNLDVEWDFVFMDEEVSADQIPRYLVDNCHPGWMLPPAKIYIVAQRVVHGCGSKDFKPGYVADGDLAKVLLHEIGHSIEFQLLDKKQNSVRGLAEGFASWFEQESAEYSSLIAKGSTKDYYFGLAKKSIDQNPNRFIFRGSAYDYARASLYYHAVVNRGSIGHLMDIYDYQVQGIDFFSAVGKRMGWSQSRHDEEVAKLVR